MEIKTLRELVDLIKSSFDCESVGIEGRNFSKNSYDVDIHIYGLKDDNFSREK